MNLGRRIAAAQDRPNRKFAYNIQLADNTVVFFDLAAGIQCVATCCG
jgi:hypothetical protein